MPECIFLMHDDANDGEPAWEPYLHRLNRSGCFQGGSAIGDGICARKIRVAPSVTAHVTGYIRVVAESLDRAKSTLTGNSVYEAGGTVEIRELPRTHRRVADQWPAASFRWPMVAGVCIGPSRQLSADSPRGISRAAGQVQAP
jgi:hypothetical protein